MLRGALICMSLGALTTLAFTASISSDPFIDLPLKKLKTSADRIREHGYPAESHFVTTSDGYVLNVFRIPYSPRLNNEGAKKPAVLLQHGLMSCSDCYLLNGPDNALAFNFADAGFDVWLGNARGNVYSRNHTTLSPNQRKFWRFGWHEIGVIDTPATIDFILNKTGESSLHYVGHSQGSTVFFVMAAERPEYNEKIRTSHMLAPPVFRGNITVGLVKGLAAFVGKPGIATDLLKDQEFLPNNPLVMRILATACGGRPQVPAYCPTLYLLSGNSDESNMNKTLLPQLLETFPAGMSTNQEIHVVQLYVSNEFRQFDYGVKKNLEVYGAEEPSDYQLENISAEMYLYYALADTASTAKDIQRLPEHLSNLKLFYQIPDPTWSHSDFILAMQVKEVINDVVIKYCKDYDSDNEL